MVAAPGVDEPLNQPPPLPELDLFATDPALSDAVRRHVGEERYGEARKELSALGVLAGSDQAREWGRLANVHSPVLQTHDRYGHRIDEVEFHPAWHSLMRIGVAHGLGAAPWTADTATMPHTMRTAKVILWSQAEAGHICPLSMTYAAAAALRTDPALAAEWTPRLASTVYDFGLRTPAEKDGCLAGMGMTEKQGGSDVRANTTQAVPLSSKGEYELFGHKWFCSAPMCDVFLVLAQAPEGLTCFVVPRVLPDRTRNVFRLQRLKDKLGNRSNASSEVEFAGTWARRLGAEGRGVATIIEMVGMTRLDCVAGSTALMRAAVIQAHHHVRHRHAFGKALIDQPLMRNVLADLAIESEAATATSLRLAAAFDVEADGPRAERERSLRRIALAASKYWVTKRTSAVAAEALECFGGNGYVEESGMPRLYREAPLNSIWEGSGNVNALDVLRALRKEPGVLDAYLAEIGAANGADPRYDAAARSLLTMFADVEGAEWQARRLVERMALLFQGSLLIRFGTPAIADAFAATRLGDDWGHAFGTLPRGVDEKGILDRVLAD